MQIIEKFATTSRYYVKREDTFSFKMLFPASLKIDFKMTNSRVCPINDGLNFSFTTKLHDIDELLSLHSSAFCR